MHKKWARPSFAWAKVSSSMDKENGGIELEEEKGRSSISPLSPAFREG